MAPCSDSRPHFASSPAAFYLHPQLPSNPCLPRLNPPLGSVSALLPLQSCAFQSARSRSPRSPHPIFKPPHHHTFLFSNFNHQSTPLKIIHKSRQIYMQNTTWKWKENNPEESSKGTKWKWNFRQDMRKQWKWRKVQNKRKFIVRNNFLLKIEAFIEKSTCRSR